MIKNMLHKLLCKYNIHKYVQKATVNYYRSRYITGYSDVEKTKFIGCNIIHECIYCGKQYRDIEDLYKTMILNGKE